jgi:hypothetical protein
VHKNDYRHQQTDEQRLYRVFTLKAIARHIPSLRLKLLLIFQACGERKLLLEMKTLLLIMALFPAAMKCGYIIA